MERGIMVTNDVGEVGVVARDEGDSGLEELEIVVGRPVQPMLAQTGNIESIIEDAGDEGEVAVEWKYDGARLQIHNTGEEIELYS
ncbi:MAG: DNA ligase, partial [Halobacteria archaeon]|nr:DNA ligase [Halobacteria archaeon]